MPGSGQLPSDPSVQTETQESATPGCFAGVSSRVELSNNEQTRVEQVVPLHGLDPDLAETLPPELRRQYLAEARAQLGLLRQIPDWNNCQPTTGLEAETFIVEQNCRPAGSDSRLFAQAKEQGFSVVHECGKSQAEHNSSVRPMAGDFLYQHEVEARIAREFMNRELALEDRTPCSAGVLPSFMPSQLNLNALTAVARYPQLISSLAKLRSEYPLNEQIVAQGLVDQNKNSFRKNPAKNDKIEIVGPNETVRFVTQAPQVLSATMMAAICSLQTHHPCEDLDDYILTHRLADLLAPLLVAIAANSPITLGVNTGLKAARGILWHAGIHPDRYGFGPDWISDPFEQFERAISGDGTARPLISLDAIGKVMAGIPAELTTLAMHCKTFWPHNRTTLCIADDLGLASARVESRVACKGLTDIDDMANAAWSYGAIIGMKNYLRQEYGLTLNESPAELNRRMNFNDVWRNYESASCYALQSRFTWIDGEEIDARSLLLRLMPVIDQGLHSRFVSEALRDRYLGVLMERLNTQLEGQEFPGATAADVQIALWNELRHLPPGERGIALTKILIEITAADTLESPLGAVGWMNQRARLARAGSAGRSAS